MKLLLSSLQLASLCALSSWSASSQLVVSQSQDDTVMEGDTINISCCWTTQTGRIRVTWMKNETTTTAFTNGILNVTSKSDQKSYCLNLTLANITQDQSGTYICKVSVEIPFYLSGEGNGTVITVVSNNVSDNKNSDQLGGVALSPSHIILIGLAVVVSILLIVLMWVCCQRRRQALAARVIYEVPHFDSETPEVDKHNTGSSSGSSQWCQVPVYEPYSYFEHGEDKKSG